MRRDKTSVSREDYLKAIWEIVQEEQEPISARLAEELGVTPPAVTAALKRLARDGLLRVERSGRIELTRKGRSMADHLAMRHQLAEKLLTEVIGLDWTRAHDEAERLEHGISPEVENCSSRGLAPIAFARTVSRCAAAWRSCESMGLRRSPTWLREEQSKYFACTRKTPNFWSFSPAFRSGRGRERVFAAGNTTRR
jgi:Mn-dependent DtxR family transcriptional regulator